MKRRCKTVATVAAIIVGVALLYPLSMGPAIRIAMPRGSWAPARWFTKVYAPLIWTIKQRQPGG